MSTTGTSALLRRSTDPPKRCRCAFHDRLAEYLFEMAPELELAYAITVHKSQGSEFDAVVMPITGSKSKMHYRNLLYTAVTRARRRLIILGQPRHRDGCKRPQDGALHQPQGDAARAGERIICSLKVQSYCKKRWLFPI